MDLRYALPLVAMAALALPSAASAQDFRNDEARDSSGDAGALPMIRLLTRVDVHTQIRQPIANGCDVESMALGSFDESHLDGRANGPLRNVDVTGVSVLQCDGREVRSIKQRFVLPTLESRERLAAMLSQDLTAQAPGSACAWTPTFRFDKDALQATSIVNSCSPRDTVASLAPHRAWDRLAGPAGAARGGGPTSKW